MDNKLKIITRKPEIKEKTNACLKVYFSHGITECVKETEKRILTKKVKFPLLEYCATLFYETLPEEEHITFCDNIESLKTIGGNVILGIILQKRLSLYYKQSLKKATEYISKADAWYVCDIIGERVFGFSLLHEPEKTLSEIKKLSIHNSNWVVRSLGAGAHYAIKKGLNKNYTSTVFEILLSMANTKDKEIKQGVGWAAKTTAKFYPDIIDHYKNEIQDTNNVANWFRMKVKIGLNRNLYAKGNRS